MKKITPPLLLAAAATFFASCGGAAVNPGVSNANTNTSKPVVAAPTVDALMAVTFTPGSNNRVKLLGCSDEN